MRWRVTCRPRRVLRVGHGLDALGVGRGDGGGRLARAAPRGSPGLSPAAMVGLFFCLQRRSHRGMGCSVGNVIRQRCATKDLRGGKPGLAQQLYVEQAFGEALFEGGEGFGVAGHGSGSGLGSGKTALTECQLFVCNTLGKSLSREVV